MAVVLSSVQIAGILGGPLSGQILENFSGVFGLRGWQWLFVLEGGLPMVLGLVAYRMLADAPARAPWLDEREKALVRIEVVPPGTTSTPRFVDAFKSGRTYTLGLGYFSVIFGLYVLTFWTPTLIAGAHIAQITTIGYLSSVPSAAAILSMLWLGRIADKTGRPTSCSILGAVIGAAGLSIIPFVADSIPRLLAVLCFASAGLSSATSCFWAIPRPYRGESDAAGGIAVINTLGALGGFVGPALMGWATDVTGKVDAGLNASSIALVIGSLLFLCKSIDEPAHVRQVVQRTDSQ
jgi:nitrate/nitrite transporter NarK